MGKNKQQDQEWASEQFNMLNGMVEKLPVYYDIEKDLQYLFADKRRFTRPEALRMIVIKIQIIKDPDLIVYYLRLILKFQAERFHFIDYEKPGESLSEFISDLFTEFAQAGVPITEDKQKNEYLIKWKGQMNAFFQALQNSITYLNNGFYDLDSRPKLDGLAKEFLNIVKGGSNEDEDFVNYEEIKAALKVSKNDTFAKYFTKLGIQRFGGHNTPLIRKSDFIKLKEFWKTR